MVSITEWAKKHRFKKGEEPQYLKDIMEELKKGGPVKMVYALKGQTPGPTCAPTDRYFDTEKEARDWAKRKLDFKPAKAGG